MSINSKKILIVDDSNDQHPTWYQELKNEGFTVSMELCSPQNRIVIEQLKTEKEELQQEVLFLRRQLEGEQDEEVF